MNDFHKSSPELQSPFNYRKVREEAALWVVRRDRGLTAIEKQEYTAWMLSDPRVQTVLAEMEKPFLALDGARAFKPNGATNPDPDLLLHIRPRKSRLSLVPMLSFGCAVAATIAIGFFILKAPSSPPLEPPRHGSVIERSPERMVLSDGSVVELQTGAHAKVAYTDAERRVFLTDGNANFSVAKDHNHPFVVVAGGVAVQAVGTVFEVENLPSKIQVTVSEGRVRVDDDRLRKTLLAPISAAMPNMEVNDIPVLSAGYRVAIPIVNGTPASAVPVLLNADQMERELAWRNVWLDFAEMPLADVAEKFNKYNDSQLRIFDKVTGNIRVTGSFRADGELGFVRLLETSFGVVASKSSGGEIVLRKVRQ